MWLKDGETNQLLDGATTKTITSCVLHISRVRSYGACCIRLPVPLVPNVACVVYPFCCFTGHSFILCNVTFFGIGTKN